VPGLTGGGGGLNVPLIRWSPQAVGNLFLFVMVGFFLLVAFVTYVVQNSRLGFGLRCIQQNEDAAEMVGINTTAYKIAAYVLSAVFCGGVGAAYASWTGYIDPNEAFNSLMSIKVPVMTLLGGAGSLLGPALGAAVFTILEELAWSNFLDWNHAIVGLVVVALVFFLPNGLLRFNSPFRVTRDGLRRIFGMRLS
jgi:branched-chain amino acid transport system permease protein